MRFLWILGLVGLMALAPGGARAGARLDAIKKRGSVKCGSELRTGLAAIDQNRSVSGLIVDACRAIAVAVLGPDAKVEFRSYDSSKDYDAIRRGEDDVFFLTTTEVMDEDLAAKILPGPVVYNEWHGLMTADSFKGNGKDLAGAGVCFMIGSGAARSMEAWFGARHIDFTRNAYTEDIEMIDAYNVKQCKAIVGEATTLADIRRHPGVMGFSSRILPEPLAIIPIFADTMTDDAQLSSVVAWTIHTLQLADVPEAPWVAGGIKGLPMEADELDLKPGWQKVVVDTIGSYGDIFRRRLGAASSLNVPRGPNALWTEGGLFTPPSIE